MSKALYALIVLVAVAGVFQFFLRYAYIASGPRLVRVDRLTQRACVVAPVDHCSAMPAPAIPTDFGK